MIQSDVGEKMQTITSNRQDSISQTILVDNPGLSNCILSKILFDSFMQKMNIPFEPINQYATRDHGKIAYHGQYRIGPRKDSALFLQNDNCLFVEYRIDLVRPQENIESFRRDDTMINLSEQVQMFSNVFLFVHDLSVDGLTNPDNFAPELKSRATTLRIAGFPKESDYEALARYIAVQDSLLKSEFRND